MKRHLWQIILLVLLAVRCSDDDQLNEQVENEEPEVTEIGASIGDPMTADIGPEGGSLTSEDEQLTITVPAGAITGNTTFSIEPIVDFCPGGIASYRLLPEGLIFSTPVTITFHYTEEDLEGTLSEFLELAYQGSDNIWYSLTWVTVDEAAKTISAPVKHFTRWSVASKLRIEPRRPAIPVIEKSSTLNLHLAGAKDIPPKKLPPDNPGEDELPPLPMPKKKHVPFKATWFVNGVSNGNDNVGTISVRDEIKVTYHAPAEVPVNNPVLVSAELTDFEAWDKVDGKIKKLNKVILYKRIKIKPDEYNFTLEVKYNADNPCGVPGQQYKDAVEMDVQVKRQDGNETVTFSHIVNQDATVTPFQVKLESCTYSCFTGGEGIINVTKGIGTVPTQSNGLVIDLKNTNSTSPGSQMECPNQPTIPPIINTNPEDYFHFEFALSSDEDQIINNGVLWAKLSPK